MAVVLFQITHDGAGSLSRTRRLHPVDETQEYVEASARRGPDYSSRSRVLRLTKPAFTGQTIPAIGNPLRVFPPMTIRPSPDPTRNVTAFVPRSVTCVNLFLGQSHSGLATFWVTFPAESYI